MINRPAAKALNSFLNLHEKAQHGKTLFVNGFYNHAMTKNECDILQYDIRLRIGPEERFIKQPQGFYQNIWMLGSKQVEETRGLIALSLLHASEGAQVIIALENDLGGRTIGRDLRELEIDFDEDSRAHSRLYYFISNGQNYNQEKLMLWRQQADFSKILQGQFLSCPGLYGWDVIDDGSELLMKTINKNLTGKIADFGCGYGYLSVQAAKKYDQISQIIYADCDLRALHACGKNLEEFSVIKTPALRDLTSTPLESEVDHIIMNPPFHRGQKADSSLGKRFIKSAALSLKNSGTLWFVANRHLPYEESLKECFRSFSLKADIKGFKVYEAVK